MQYLVTFCSRSKTASDVISRGFVNPIVPCKPVKLRDPRLNLSREISTAFFLDNFRSEVDSDVISGVVADPTGLKFHVKFGDSHFARKALIGEAYIYTNHIYAHM